MDTWVSVIMEVAYLDLSFFFQWHEYEKLVVAYI
jgi:hypothetical protein